MRNFTCEQFRGAGQYLLRMSPKEIATIEAGVPFEGYKDAGWLSTITYKVGYIINNHNIGNGEQLITLVSMSDGFTRIGHYDTETELYNGGKFIFWQYDGDDASRTMQVFVDYLNNTAQEMRFATQEEIIRVIDHQVSRCA